MKKRFLAALTIMMLCISCSTEQDLVADFGQQMPGTIKFSGCFCSQDAYRYLIEYNLGNKSYFLYPLNLSDDYKLNNLQVLFSGQLQSDSTIVYTNAPNDALIVNFKAPNLSLRSIERRYNLLVNQNDTLKPGITYFNSDEKISLSFTAVTEESRCPIGAVCVWEGNAKTAFTMTMDRKSYNFSLNTGGGFRRDTLIGNYNVEMKALLPLPMSGKISSLNDYTTVIKVTKK